MQSSSTDRTVTMQCQFIPPYLLQRLVTHAEEQSICDVGEATLRVDRQLRAARSAPQESRRAPTTVLASESPTDKRAVHTADNTEQLPGVEVRRDGEPASGDEAVDEAFNSSGQVWDLFAEHFGRLSVDGSGSTISITVHYGTNYDNAFWDGQQLVFGDGDKVVFDRFTKPMDVLAHEFTHGVTQFTAGLTYQGQSGALNESVSDVFAAMTKQKVLQQTAESADWLIGEGLFLPGINAVALRSMKAPGTAYDDPQLGKDPQVGSMNDYVDTEEDNGGVHLNSGIPNRAFYLASVALGGSSWERAGQVWYDALTAGEVTADTDFTGFAQATITSASKLFADDASVAAGVRGAWVEVGLLATGDQPTGQDSAPTPTSDLVAVRRSGGFTGVVRTAEMDIASDPRGLEVQSLLNRVDVASLSFSAPMPDRFVYTVEYRQLRVSVPEQDLTPELGQVVRMVLGDR